MADTAQIDKILSLFKQLDQISRGRVLEKLKQASQPSSNENGNSLYDLAGLGAETWEGIDPDEYIRNLREEWD